MRACARCGKSYTLGGTRKLLRGHYNPTASPRKKANLQWTRLFNTGSASSSSGKTGKRILVCTNCLRTLTKKQK